MNEFMCWLCASLSTFASFYNDDVSTEFGVSAALGDPFYISASYEPALEATELGQQYKLDIYGITMGYRGALTKRLSVSAELGYFYPDVKIKPVVESEIVEYRLVNDFGKRLWHPQAETRSYKLDEGWGGRVSASYKVNRWIDVFAAVRLFSSGETFRMCTTEPECLYPVPAGDSYWIEKRQKDFHAAQIGVTLKLIRR